MLLPVLMMSVGWALRGSIGGGPLGAMIPGALWAMAIARRQGWSVRQASLFIALSALGVGLGGQMTYGQTIGLLREPDTRLWGLLGLTLKGAIWGLLAGAAIGMVWARPRRPLTASLLLIVATQIGWQFIGQPKLIYFSNRLLQPRAEIWAGLLLSALALMSYLKSYRLALHGAAGGAIGFGMGSLWNLVPIQDFPGWKAMEFSFGAVLGLAMTVGLPKIAPPESPVAPRFAIFAYPLLALAIIGLNERLELRYAFTAVVALSFLLLLRYPQFGWTLGFGVTLAAACLGLAPKHPVWAILLATIPIAFLEFRPAYERFALPLLLVCCCWIYCLEYLPIFR